MASPHPHLDHIFEEIERKFAGTPADDPVLLKAYDDAKYQFFKALFTRQFVADYMEDGTVPLDGEAPAKYKRLIDKQYINNSTKSPFVFLTVNPRRGVSFEEVDTAVQKLLRKKTIPRWAYVYEVRAEEEKGEYTGLHCHMLLEYTTKPYDFKRSAKSTFSKICDYNNPNILNFKFVPEDSLETKIQYMLGGKTDKKLPGVNLTNEWREQRGLEALYESIPPLPCRDTQKPPLIELAEEEKDN